MSNVSFIKSLDQFERDEFGRYLIHDCVVDVGVWPGVVGNEPWINSICTRNPGKGNASRALDTLVLLADKHTVPLMLCVSPLTQKQKRILSKTNLISWYKRHGFEFVSYSYMRHSLHEEFVAWVRDNYKDPECTETLDHYVQSGEYPEEFTVFKSENV